MITEHARPIEHRENQPQSKIELRFFRHSIKEKDPNKNDYQISITPEGKVLAKDQASSEIDFSQAVAFGSPRLRAQETAAFVMAGKQGGITGEETLEELREKIDVGLGQGTKVAVSEALDFRIDETNEFGKKFYEAFRAGCYLAFLVQDSDRVAQELHDDESDTYSRMAARIATLVEKYVSIAPRFNTLVSSERASEKITSNVMHRFFGTHQGVAESFLAKVIEKTKGATMRDRFVAVLDNQGFDFTEGFSLDIQTFASGTCTLHISFKKEKEGEGFVFDEQVPIDVIDEIISEGIAG